MREGAAIETELRMRAASIREIWSRAWKRSAARALPYFHQRLRERLGELLNGAQIDPARLAQEAAILAERSDISEELVRLKTHADQTGAPDLGRRRNGQEAGFSAAGNESRNEHDPFENRRSGRDRAWR